MIQLTSIRTVLLSISVAAVITPILAFTPTASAAHSRVDGSASRSVVASRGFNYFGCAMYSLYGSSVDVPNLIDTSSGCYELYVDGVLVSLQKGLSLQQAIDDLEHQKINHSHTRIMGYFSGLTIGYELYWDGVRVGYEPGWTLAEAIANLEWNRATYPEKTVEGYFYGLPVALVN